MQRLAWLAQVQTERIQILMEGEKLAPRPMRDTDRAIEILHDILDTFIQFQMDLGLIDSKPPEINVNLNKTCELVLSKFDDGGAKLRKVVDRFSDLLEDAIVIEEDKDDQQQRTLPAESSPGE